MRAVRVTLLLTVVLLLVAIPCRADLVGTQVTGSLTFPGSSTNYLDPSVFGGMLIPAADLNAAQGTTVTISATATEFGYNDGSSAISADFTGTQLTLIDSTSGASGWTITFTDTSFAGLSLVSSGFTGLTFGSSGDVLRFNWAGVPSASQSHQYSAVFNIVDPPPPGVPEPPVSGFLIAGLGIFGLMALKRKRVA